MTNRIIRYSLFVIPKEKLPAVPLACTGNVREMMTRVPCVESEHPLEGPGPGFGMNELASEILIGH